jgi:hypothetical protein
MSVRNYIENARNAASESYNDFTGNGHPSNGGFPRFNNWSGNKLQPMKSPMNAAGTNPAAPQSQPYIITISNASATAVNSFDILGAYTYIGNSGFSAGSLTISGVTISSAIANVTYQQFLYQSMNQPFQVGLTYIQSVTGSQAQITQTFTLTTQDANGNTLSRVIVPVINPFQQQSGIVSVPQLYSIDGFTKITYNQILASVVFQIQFYPAANINLASGLQGNAVTNNFGSPNISYVPLQAQQ